MAVTPTKDELEAERCWEANDLVPRRPLMTEFRQRTRLHQARWREAHGHPIGTPGKRSRNAATIADDASTA